MREHPSASARPIINFDSTRFRFQHYSALLVEPVSSTPSLFETPVETHPFRVHYLKRRPSLSNQQDLPISSMAHPGVCCSSHFGDILNNSDGESSSRGVFDRHRWQRFQASVLQGDMVERHTDQHPTSIIFSFPTNLSSSMRPSPFCKLSKGSQIQCPSLCRHIQPSSSLCLIHPPLSRSPTLDSFPSPTRESGSPLSRSPFLFFIFFIQVYRLFLEFAFFSYLSYFNLSNLFSCFAVLFTLLYIFDRPPVPTHSTSSWGCLRVVFYFILFCLFVVSYLYGGALAQRLLFSFVVSV